ncbi:hypothetical protein [Mycolicibacterium lutetiense]|uniref:Uncharacterized protein n=1 Tax=Mycolicibacterium lutetiense TaxID=1641992 RepID=A0ABS5A380_9MYCO|nr:hypothetical protein [Mycolicibacterium lutetiense]MBP2456210.1 hypothetical protein [Mycolicibacterium lutetiense]
MARLETLRAGRRPVDEEVRHGLARWAGPDAPNDIALRGGYVRRLTPLVEDVEYDLERLVDRPKPKLPDPPPLAVLASLTKGVALPLSLTLCFLAQTQPRATIGKDGLVKIPIEASEDHPVGLVNLLAVPASHRPSEESTFSSNSRENRKRQIRGGFVQLDKQGLAELPTGGRKGAPRFNVVHLNEDTRASASAVKRYTRPRTASRVVTIPLAFFLNGWVHALSKSEIAMWLMLRDLAQRSDRTHAPDQLHISGRERLLQYDLSRAVWDTHSALEDFGLIVVHKDPNRRANGTTLDGERAAPHRFELRDEGLAADGLATVLKSLAERRDRKPK